jgi:hypothetical protein
MIEIPDGLIAEEYIDLSDANGEKVDWILFDFRDKPFNKYNPAQLKAVSIAKRQKKIERWLVATVILWALALLSWWAWWM